ncbi:hypothetical protein DKM44_10355 [Deinococcus irradiatisoli]|uniref:DUF4259 domain-containing protein n=1 Tax=Deinococcus irradiatisoli TaxID=2202254 RepID=A0A2Z3JJT6_9DEIO|nr:DUF4259 domain-containing protein [Deinococcus irradiatisoli]AWN23580.1 hypothetical protein DKM44_10355 [Deinococcus irradiatisoli]
MNTWGPQPFDNDAAKMFVQEVLEDGPFALQEAFEVVLDPDTDFVAQEEGARAVAAAEILSAHLGGDTSAIFDAALRDWLGQLGSGQLAPLRELAAEALERVIGPHSDLPDFWADTEEGEFWLGNVARLRAALG